MLKLLRFLENLFYSIGSWFEDVADGIDKDLHSDLGRALKSPVARTLSPQQAVKAELLPCKFCGRLTHSELKYCGLCNGGSRSA